MTFLLETLPALLVPLVLALAAFPLASSKKDYVSAFRAGAEEGLRTAVGLLPSLVLLLTALSMLSASGFVEFLASHLAGACRAVGIPAEILPLALTRPFSGAASTAGYAELMETYGPDSFPALCAAVLMGSSDTAVYVVSVYFSGAGVGRTRHALPAALLTGVFALVLACLLCRLFFGG